MRRCLHCDREITPQTVSDGAESSKVVQHVYEIAWLSGYCTPMCQRQAALTAVANGSAWWMRGEK